jgi:hypothetical protein
MHRLERHARVDLPDHRAHHLAALVHLRDQRVGRLPAIERDRASGAADGAQLRGGCVLQH